MHCYHGTSNLFCCIALFHSSLAKSASWVGRLANPFCFSKYFLAHSHSSFLNIDPSKVPQWGCYVLGVLYNKSGAFGRHIIVVEETNPQGIVKMELVGPDQSAPVR